MTQLLTLAAKRSEQMDSPDEDASGEMFTNISILESPERQGCLG